MYGLKKVLLYSVYSMLFSMIVLLFDFIFHNQYMYNPDITLIAVIKYCIISVIIFLYYSFVRVTHKINSNNLLLTFIIIDLIVFFIFQPFSKNYFAYLKISIFSSILPIYIMNKNDILSKIEKHVQTTVSYKTFCYIKYLIYFIIYMNPLLILTIILMFISYDFVMEDVIIVLSLSVMIYTIIKFFVGLYFANKIISQPFYIECISKKIKKIYIIFIIIDILNIYVYNLCNGCIYIREIFYYLFNLSLSFAFLPFYIFHKLNRKTHNKRL